MPDFNLPVLGFDGRDDDACTQDAAPLVARWKDGRIVGGILGGDIEQALARRREEDAEEAQKQILRSQGITVLADFRKDTSNGSFSQTTMADSDTPGS